MLDSFRQVNVDLFADNVRNATQFCQNCTTLYVRTGGGRQSLPPEGEGLGLGWVVALRFEPIHATFNVENPTSAHLDGRHTRWQTMSVN